MFSWLGKERKRRDLPAGFEYAYLQANVKCLQSFIGLVWSYRSHREAKE